jgi:hypothetical protein
MEVRFAELRERLYADKMEEAAREEAMILDGSFDWNLESCAVLTAFKQAHTPNSYFFSGNWMHDVLGASS